MRLLHVIDSLATGGAERMAVNLSNDLAGRGHDVHLMTTRAEGPLRDEIDASVHHVHLGRRRTADLGALRRMRAYVRDHRIELIHAHGTSAFFTLVAVVGPKAPPVIYHDHFGGGPDANRRRVPYRLLARRAASIIVVNEQLRRWHIDVAGAAPDRCVVLPNFSRLAIEPVDRSGEVGGGGPVQVVSVGNVRPEKDYATLVEAFARVPDALDGPGIPAAPDVRLRIAGSLVDEAEVDRVRRLVTALGIDDRVTLLGTVRDVGPLLASADIGVSSSATEGFPLSVLEYGLAGLAVVATDVGGTSQILDEGAAGILVPRAAPDALATALARLIDVPAERARLGARLHAHVTTHFTESHVVDDLELIYGRVGRCDNLGGRHG